MLFINSTIKFLYCSVLMSKSLLIHLNPTFFQLDGRLKKISFRLFSDSVGFSENPQMLIQLDFPLFLIGLFLGFELPATRVILGLQMN